MDIFLYSQNFFSFESSRKKNKEINRKKRKKKQKHDALREKKGEKWVENHSRFFSRRTKRKCGKIRMESF